jgi:hypothetical protein
VAGIEEVGPALAVAKSPSGGDLPGLERDVVSERFELSDEAFGEAVGVWRVK